MVCLGGIASEMVMYARQPNWKREYRRWMVIRRQIILLGKLREGQAGLPSQPTYPTPVDPIPRLKVQAVRKMSVELAACNGSRDCDGGPVRYAAVR